MEKVISFVVRLWPTCKQTIIEKENVQNQNAVLSQLDIIEELIEIIDRTINIERFNKTINEFIKQVKCITASIKDLDLVYEICSEVMLLLQGAHVDASKFMRCNMNRDSYDAEYHEMQGSEEFKVIIHAVLKNMLEKKKKERIMNKINDQQEGYTSKDADHSDKIICDQQNQAIVVDHQNENKLNVVMSNHNNQSDKINCDQQNGLNFVDKICENKSVLNIVDKNHNKDTEGINHCHENELNFVHEIHHNHVDKINNCQQINFDNDMYKNDDNNNNLNVIEKKIKFGDVNNKHDNDIRKIKVGQQYKIGCAKNKHKKKIKLKLINNKMKDDDKIKCKIKLKCLHLLNNNNEHSNDSKYDDKFGYEKKYCVRWDMCDTYVLDCRVSDGDGKSSWLLSFASCQGPGGMLTIVFVCELQWRIPIYAM